MFRDMVRCPRKGYFAFCLWSALLLRFSFCFLCSGEQQPQTRTQTKKRWGPALGQPSWGLGNGWSPSQGRNSASRKEKFAYIKRNKSVSHNTERTKPQIPKPHAEKKQQSIMVYTAIQTIGEHLSCMRRIDRKQPTVREAMHRSTADRRRKVT